MMNIYKEEKYSIGLAFYRILISLILLKNNLFYFNYYDVFFGKYKIDESPTTFVDYFFLHLPLDTKPLLLITTLLGILFLFGIGRWVIGLALFFSNLLVNKLLPNALDGSDNVIHVILPFLIFSNSYQSFVFHKQPRLLSVDKISKRSKAWPIISAHFHTGLLIQICFIYFFAALSKIQGPLWQNGTAIYYIMRLDEFRQTDLIFYLIRNAYFVTLATYTTIVWELAFGFLVWFKPTKLPILFIGALIHLFIFIFMKIDNFSWVMIGSYLTFLNNRFYFRLFLAVKNITSRVSLNSVYFNNPSFNTKLKTNKTSAK